MAIKSIAMLRADATALSDLIHVITILDENDLATPRRQVAIAAVERAATLAADLAELEARVAKNSDPE